MLTHWKRLKKNPETVRYCLGSPCWITQGIVLWDSHVEQRRLCAIHLQIGYGNSINRRLQICCFVQSTSSSDLEKKGITTKLDGLVHRECRFCCPREQFYQTYSQSASQQRTQECKCFLNVEFLHGMYQEAVRYILQSAPDINYQI